MATSIATRVLSLLSLPLLFAAANAFAQYDARFVSQVVPTAMAAGSRYLVSITLLNTGSTVWTNTTGPGTANSYSLGSQNPQDNTNWALAGFPGRVPVSGSVAPGATTTFNFWVVAPRTPGSYDFQWEMVDDFVTWFGERTPNVSVQVSPSFASSASLTPNARFVAQSVPASMTAGQRYSVSVTLQNSGTTTWTNTTGAGTPNAYSLGSQNPQDNVTWGVGGYPNRVPVAGSVAPGATATFNFDVVAPVSPGTYSFQWQMVDDYVTWFGESTPSVDVVVSPQSVPNAEFVSQELPSSMTTGERYPVSITLRNTGNTIWTNTTGPGTAGAYSLGTQNPQDNTVWNARGFLNRVPVPGSVPPGATATFSFDVEAPATPGEYAFQWQMVDDYVTWFGAATPNVLVTVASPIDFVAGPIGFDAGSLGYWQPVIGDVNGDGWLEPFGTVNAGGGTLSVKTAASMGLTDLFSGDVRPNDFRVGDLNGDGCDDMVAEGYSAHSTDTSTNSRALLYINDGSGIFTADAAFAALNLNGRGEGLVIADFNNDGALDLYVPYYTFGLSDGSCFPAEECPNAPQSYLLLNDGKGGFAEGDVPGTVDLSITPGGQPEGVQAADINDDGRVDLYVSGHVFLNQGTDATEHVSFVDCNCGVHASPYGGLVDEGAKFLDWNNDGLIDLILHDPYAGPQLYENVGTRTAPQYRIVATRLDGVTPEFAEKFEGVDATLYRALSFCASYGMNIYDLDNDGLEDVVVTGSPAPGSPGCDYPNAVFRNTGNGFESVAAGAISGYTAGGVYGFGDIDRDGRIDVMYIGPWPYYFINRTSASGTSSFLIDVRGADGRQTEQGRMVRVTVPKAGCASGIPGCTMTRVVDGGSGYHSQNQYPILVGSPYGGDHAIEVVLPTAGDPGRLVTMRAIAKPGQYVEFIAPSLSSPAGQVLHLDAPAAPICRTN